MNFCLRIFAVLSLIALGACDYVLPSMTINYKVTVEIETPEGVKSGYAVQQISSSTPLFRLPDVGNPANIKGEAVIVDLGQRGKIFALLPDQSWQNGLYQAFPFKGAATKDGILYYRSLKIGSKAEWHQFKPRFVFFQDIADPASVTLLRNGDVWNDKLKQSIADDYFEEVFGQGVRLKRIIVEVTDEPVTVGINQLITWLPEYYNKKFDGRRINTIKAKNKLANSLSSGAFSTGEQK